MDYPIHEAGIDALQNELRVALRVCASRETSLRLKVARLRCLLTEANAEIEALQEKRDGVTEAEATAREQQSRAYKSACDQLAAANADIEKLQKKINKVLEERDEVMAGRRREHDEYMALARQHDALVKRYRELAAKGDPLETAAQNGFPCPPPASVVSQSGGPSIHPFGSALMNPERTLKSMAEEEQKRLEAAPLSPPRVPPEAAS